MILEENYCYKNGKQTLFIADNLYGSLISTNIYNDLINVTEDPVIKHHINKYGNIIPLWVIVNYISFGTLINLIMCFTSYKLNELMRGNILSKKGKSTFYPWLKSIQMLRNKISHHNNILGKESAFIINGYPKSIYQAGIEGIEAWSKLLLIDTDTPQRIRQNVNKIIAEINKTYMVSFTISIIINKKHSQWGPVRPAFFL
jgi:abortive infection bacteriophage resistance protein